MPRKSATSAVAPPPRRRRRTAVDARAAILDVAERQLVAAGPDALRLQVVAAEVGVSHPTVLHHFGSREALVHAVVTRAFAALQADVVSAISRMPPDGERLAAELDVASLIERVAAALGPRGHGRALAWLALSGRLPDADELGIREAAEASHALRRARRGADTPPFEDTQFTLLLSFYALFAQSIAGPAISRSAGIKQGASSEARFRRWLARLIKAQLTDGPFS